MQLDALSLYERISFLVAAATAGTAASILPCLLFPNDSLCYGYSSVLSYAGQHLFLTLCLWILVFATAWLYAGRGLLRRRQNLSTKLRLLGWSCITGVMIDSAVSIYQGANSPEWISNTVVSTNHLASLAARGLLYAGFFAAAVMAVWLGGSTRPRTVTPPPRFGRE
jgi:hypothetical protein